MNSSTPGHPVHHQLLEFTQTHLHRVSDAIQPSHSLLSPSPPALNPSQHQVFSNESTLRMRCPKYWPVGTQEESGILCFPYIPGLTPQVSLECNPEIPVAPAIPPSIRVFSNESTLRTRWPKYWSFSFSIIPSKEPQD